MNIAQYGDYNTPQTFTLAGASASAIILGQWWFDFSRIPEANVSLFMGVEERFVGPDGSILPVFGLFILPNGDPSAGNLFVTTLPDILIAPPASVPVFHGRQAKTTIPNPNAKRQVLFAVGPQTHGSQLAVPTDFAWRSLLATATGV